MATATMSTNSVLSDEMLERFWHGAADYDRDNKFFHEDFDELQAAGYFKLTVPEEFGGFGADLPRAAREQRRLAYYAPATALATNMHLYWTGTAADLYRTGDTTLQFVLEEAADGGVFGAGHGERGNDLPLFYSSSTAERVEGGYRITGHKSFGSLTPVWTRLGFHAQDNTDPDGPKVVHGFMKRDTPGYRIEETWNALGMRATRSDDTILEGAFVPDEDIVYVVPVGTAGLNLFTLGFFAWVEPLFGAIYLGQAERARDIAIEQLQSKTSVAIESGGYQHHPEFQHVLADLAMDLHSAEALIESYTADWTAQLSDFEHWTPDTWGHFAWRSVSVKHQATHAAFRAVDAAIDLAGGYGVSRSGDLERLFRDARMGKIHPANFAVTREFISKTLLGIDLDARPRWG